MLHNEREPRGARILTGGFTLIELLIVISILSLLVAVLMPSLARAQSMAGRAVCAGNLRQIHAAITLYNGDYDDMYPCAADPVSTSPYYWLWMGRGWRGMVSRYLGGGLNADNPSVLFCQADISPKNKYESTSYAYSLAFYHSAQQINAIDSAAGTYSNPPPAVAQRASCVASPANKVLVGEWNSNHRRLAADPGWWCWQGERNYLFADGRALYLRADQVRPGRDGWPDANLTFDGIQGTDLP